MSETANQVAARAVRDLRKQQQQDQQRALWHKNQRGEWRGYQWHGGKTGDVERVVE